MYIRYSSIFVICLFISTKRNFIIYLIILCLAGSYAQLTLLGQPKANTSTSQTPRIIPADIQNGRAPFRTQSSNTERSNSSLSSNSTQPAFDTKKARDSYEKILKQFEV
jgi:hypothetical protein